MTDLGNRRPLKSRGTAWAKGAASLLANADVSPDLVSAMGVVFALLGGALFMLSGTTTGWLRIAALAGAAAMIQLRLVCNLLDGMVAVEHGKGSSAGPIWNELPDRFSDVFFLAGAGYGAAAAGIFAGEAVGWIAAAAAVTTAYVRELGRGLGFPADFSGPLAKPQRMAALTLACAVSALESLWGWRGQTLMIAVSLIAAGTLLTIGLRVRNLARRLGEGK